MSANIFYHLDPFLVCLALLGLLFAAEEAGFRVRKRRRLSSGDIEQSDIALILGAVLTLLALMLGFTYAMSQGRFETRRQLVIDEANAIGTTFLRAKTLPEPRSSELQELLRQYTALRVEIAAMKDVSPEWFREMGQRSKQLHDSMWSKAAALASENPNAVVSVFLIPLNDVIDIHAKRMDAVRSRVPFSIYLVLIGISSVAVGLVGYYFGARRRRMRIPTMMFALLVAAVMWLILDLDQPFRGSITASQQSLIDLQQDLGPPARDALKGPE
jgi:hypothetical protein